MNDAKKVAYRHLIYVTCLSIRGYTNRARLNWNPRTWFTYQYHNQIIDALINWLHNLAAFSSWDFRDFEEERFWREHDQLCSRFPGERFQRFREIFDMHLNGQRMMF